MKLDKFKAKNSNNKYYLIASLSVLGIGGIFLLGRSFAKYQLQQSFPIMQGQVQISSADILITGINVDGTSQDTIPTKSEGKNFKNAVCTNGAIGIWDKDNWAFTATNYTQTKTECTLNFTQEEVKDPSTESMNDILEKQKENELPNGKLIEDKNGDDTNFRYVGSDPNNYVYFNCDDLSKQENGSCEKWRIIGLLSVENANGEKQQLLKIIRDSIGEYSWDSSADTVNYGDGVNEWSQADLQKVLNDNYFYQKAGGTCYTDSNNTTGQCPQWTSVGIKANSRSLIENVRWKTGTLSLAASQNSITPKEIYTFERSEYNGKQCTFGIENGCDDTVERTTEFIGHVGLMYPSDYGYATSGGSDDQRTQCLTTSPFEWNSDINYGRNCYTNDWLFNNTKSSLTLTPVPLIYASSVYAISEYGYIGIIEASYSNKVMVRPVVYLKSNVKISKGEGTLTNPYTLTY